MWLFSFLRFYNPLFEGPELVPLCDNNFSTHLRAIRSSILFFKSENCQYCQLLLPTIKEQAHKYRYRGFFGIIDINKCPKTEKFYNVTSYPHLLYVRYGDRPFANPEKIQGAALIKRVLLPPSTHCRSFRDVQETADRNRSFFLIDHQLLPDEDQLVDKFTSDHRFLSIDSFESLPLKFESKIMYYRSVDRQFVSVGNSLSVMAIEKFLVNGTTPSYVEFSSDRVTSLMIENAFHVLVKFEVGRESFGNEQFVLLTSLTEFQIPLFYFTFEQASVFNELINPPADLETVVAVFRIVADQKQRWVLTDSNRPALDFVSDVLKGRVPLYIKSEEPPLDNTGLVKKVVGSTYAELVTKANLPCVLLFYSLENYVFEVFMERLNEAALELQGQALFGHLNAQSNEVPLEVPAELPVFVFIRNGIAQPYTKDEKASLVEWLRMMLEKEL
jgi:thiol-disulfide isomerase/thioredoxin